MCTIYNGKKAKDLTKPELIAAILRKYKIPDPTDGTMSNVGKVSLAMGEIFQHGFTRGEQYATDITNTKGE